MILVSTNAFTNLVYSSAHAEDSIRNLFELIQELGRKNNNGGFWSKNILENVVVINAQTRLTP